MSAYGIGLYFDAKRVYLAELRKEFGEIHVSRSAEIDIPPPASGILHELGPETWAAVKEAFQKTGIRPRGVAVALPEREIMVRSFDMPLLPRKERAAAMRFESQKYLPFDVRDLYSDADMTPDPKNKKMSVAFVAARKQTVDDLAVNLDAIGVQAGAVEPASVAMIRTLQPESGKPDIRALVTIERDGSVTTVIFRGKLIFMSRASGPKPPSITSGDGPVAESVLAEIRLSFNYFAKSFKGEPIKRILVSAESADQPGGWIDTLSREFTVPVSAAPAGGLLARSKSVSPGMTAAVGAALRSVTHDGKVNLLPRTSFKKQGKAERVLSPEEEKEHLQKWILREAILALALLAGFHFYMNGKVEAQKKALQAARSAPARTATANAGMSPEQLRDRENALARKSGYLRNAVDERISLTEKLNEIARVIPGEVRLTLLDYADPTLADGRSAPVMRMEALISADSSSELALANRFVNGLKDDAAFTKGFADVKLTNVRRSGVDGTVRRPGTLGIDAVPQEKR